MKMNSMMMKMNFPGENSWADPNHRTLTVPSDQVEGWTKTVMLMGIETAMKIQMLMSQHFADLIVMKKSDSKFLPFLMRFEEVALVETKVILW
jgi:hypothetical protein